MDFSVLLREKKEGALRRLMAAPLHRGIIAAISKTDKQADTTGLLMGFVLAALGGCFVFGTPVPIYKGGGMMQTISQFTPQAHALMGYDILLDEGGGLDQALPQVLILLGFAALGLLVASWRFKFEVSGSVLP